MIIVNKTDIKENIVKVSYDMALKYFENGDHVFVDGFFLSNDELFMIRKDFDDKFVYPEEKANFYVYDDTIIVTRHDVVERFFREKMGVKGKRLSYARAHEVKNKKVYGALPLSFMDKAESLTVVHGQMSERDNIDDLTLEEFIDQIITVKTYTTHAEEIDWK